MCLAEIILSLGQARQACSQKHDDGDEESTETGVGLSAKEQAGGRKFYHNMQSYTNEVKRIQR